MRKVTSGGVRLDIYNVGNMSTTPDFSIGGGEDADLKSAQVPRSVGAVKDQADFEIYNHRAKYSTGQNTISSGDRVEYWVEYEAGVGWQREFTGIARPPDVSVSGPATSTMSFTAEDFCGAIMNWRLAEGSYRSRQVSGTQDSIVNLLLRENCPEIQHSEIRTVEDSLTIEFNAVPVLEAMRQIVARSDLLMNSVGRALELYPVTDVQSQFTLDPETDFDVLDYQENDDMLKNSVRIDGGSVVSVQDKQTDFDHYSTVSKTNRLMVLMDVPKSEVAAIDIWTDANRDPKAPALVARLQKNDNGAPVGPDNSQLDIARKTLQPQFLSDAEGSPNEDPYTYFNFGANTVLDADTWLIINTDGQTKGNVADEQRIGVGISGNPTYKSYYPFPVSLRKEDRQSIETYRKRAMQVQDDSISSFAEASDVAATKLDTHSVLERSVSFDAMSVRTHSLRAGDGIHIDSPRVGYAGDMVVTKVTDQIEGSLMNTSIEAHSLESVHKVGGV